MRAYQRERWARRHPGSVPKASRIEREAEPLCLAPHVLGYIAGILDGEGALCLGKRSGERAHHSRQFRIVVGNTSKALPEWLLATLGGNMRLASPGTPREKPVWNWELWAIEGSRLLKVVLPYLVIKRRHAEVVLAYREAGRAGDVEAMAALADEMDRLNRRGPHLNSTP